MVIELSVKLGFCVENSTPYYPQANVQVESINKVLKTMLCRMVGEHKMNWHLTLFSTLWAYKTSLETTNGLTHFQLVYILEVVLPIECDIPSLKLVIELFPNTSVEEERSIYLTNLDETQRDVTLANESYNKHIKSQYDKSSQPCVFNEGDLVLTYD